MDVKKRLLRRPLRTVMWQFVLIAMALLIGVSGVLVYSSHRLTAVLDKHHTTIAVQQMNREQLDDHSWRTYPVALYKEDIDAIKALDMVKDVDLRTLTGAYIPELSARIGLAEWGDICLMNVDQFYQYGANNSYDKIVIAGTVEKTWMDSNRSINDYDLTAVGGPEFAEGYNYKALVNIDRVIVAHEDYRFFSDEQFSGYNGKIVVDITAFYAEGDEVYGENFFEVGETYLLQGCFEPTVSRRGDYPEDIPMTPRLEGGMISLQGLHYSLKEENQLVTYTESESVWSNPDASLADRGMEYILSYGGERRILAERVETSVDDLLATERWQDIITLYDQTLHSFPVLGTENLESMYCFVKNESVIVDGRMFTQDEYDNGKKVCIISESVAIDAGIKIGDTITLNQFRVPHDYGSGNDTLDTGIDGFMNNPAIGYNPIPYGFETEDEQFTVVGIYRLANEWEDSAYSITTNTVFVPQKAQIKGGFGGYSYSYEAEETYWMSEGDSGEWVEVTGPVTKIADNGVLGVFMSVILENGRMADFEEAIKDTDYADRLFLTFDQGYEAAQESVLSVIAMAEKLFLFAGAGWILLLLLYILLGQSPERRNLGIMRSVGANSGQARRYLFVSGLIPAVMGVVIGTLLSDHVAMQVQDKLIDLTFTQSQSGAHSGGMALDNSTLVEMLSECAVSAQDILILAAVEVAIIAVLLWIHSVILSRKKPGKLLGV